MSNFDQLAKAGLIPSECDSALTDRINSLSPNVVEHLLAMKATNSFSHTATSALKSLIFV